MLHPRPEPHKPNFDIRPQDTEPDRTSLFDQIALDAQDDEEQTNGVLSNTPYLRKMRVTEIPQVDGVLADSQRLTQKF